jgi:hypothetical protein
MEASLSEVVDPRDPPGYTSAHSEREKAALDQAGRERAGSGELDAIGLLQESLEVREHGAADGRRLLETGEPAERHDRERRAVLADLASEILGADFEAPCSDELRH